MTQQAINIFNPYHHRSLEEGFEKALSETHLREYPFLEILGARWLAVTISDPESSLLRDVKDWRGGAIILPDFFAHDFMIACEAAGCGERLYQNTVIFTDLPGSTNIVTGSRSFAMNAFLADRASTFSPNCYAYDHYNQADTPIPIVPLGCADAWVVNNRSCSPVIFLDEPHMTLIEQLDNPKDMRTVLFRHALEVTKELSQMGFRIITFSRSDGLELRKLLGVYDFIEVVSIGHWIAYRSLLDMYSQASIFLSYFTETFGYPIYENLQIGNGIATYAETFNPFTVRTMQNGVILSVFHRPSIAALQIADFYNSMDRRNLMPMIREDAYLRFSCDTFAQRLRRWL